MTRDLVLPALGLQQYAPRICQVHSKSRKLGNCQLFICASYKEVLKISNKLKNKIKILNLKKSSFGHFYSQIEYNFNGISSCHISDKFIQNSIKIKKINK